VNVQKLIEELVLWRPSDEVLISDGKLVVVAAQGSLTNFLQTNGEGETCEGMGRGVAYKYVEIPFTKEEHADSVSK
jgi:hypothetical protein